MQPINHCSSSSPTRENSMSSDRNATIELLYQEYATPIYRYIFSLTKSHEQAQDITQDTFLKATVAFGTFKQGGNARSWLYHIAINTFYDSLRKGQKHPSVSLDDDVLAIVLIDQRDPFVGVEIGESIGTILSMLTRIERDAFSAWIQHYYYSTDPAQEPIWKHKAWRARKHFKHFYKALESEESA